MYKKWQYHFSEPQSLNFQGDTSFECCNLNGFWWNKSSVQYISHNQPTDGCAANKLAIVYCSLYCNILCSHFNFQKQRFLWNPFWSGSGSGHTCCLYFFFGFTSQPPLAQCLCLAFPTYIVYYLDLTNLFFLSCFPHTSILFDTVGTVSNVN